MTPTLFFQYGLVILGLIALLGLEALVFVVIWAFLTKPDNKP